MPTGGEWLLAYWCFSRDNAARSPVWWDWEANRGRQYALETETHDITALARSKRPRSKIDTATFFQIQDELCVQNGILFQGKRAVVLKALWGAVGGEPFKKSIHQIWELKNIYDGLGRQSTGCKRRHSQITVKCASPRKTTKWHSRDT